MTENNNILVKMTAEKNKKIREFIMDFLGHEPTKEERKEFTFVHSLGETKIYYKNVLVEELKYDITDHYNM